MRRRISFLFVTMLVALTAMAVIGWRTDWLLPSPPSTVATAPVRPKPPFAELTDVLKVEAESGYTVAAPPRLPGPYRRSPESTPYLSKGSAEAGLVCRIRDDAGTVTEEIRLKSLPDANQMVVILATADGKRTGVVLRRTR